jgi:hypothetical protein
VTHRLLKLLACKVAWAEFEQPHFVVYATQGDHDALGQISRLQGKGVFPVGESHVTEAAVRLFPACTAGANFQSTWWRDF